jgi:hypothetical protein
MYLQTHTHVCTYRRRAARVPWRTASATASSSGTCVCVCVCVCVCTGRCAYQSLHCESYTLQTTLLTTCCSLDTAHYAIHTNHDTLHTHVHAVRIPRLPECVLLTTHYTLVTTILTTHFTHVFTRCVYLDCLNACCSRVGCAWKNNKAILKIITKLQNCVVVVCFVRRGVCSG